ncbi:MAG: response regulator [Deltaproteobacteria bacterium]|nr:response regulator [Deltaproteobacteria bacterium]MBI3293722.1 response regulator [Deltaproteobacteria bacterium]
MAGVASLNVLLVDDNEADSYLFSEFFNEMKPDATVHCVEDGVGAMDYLLHRDSYRDAELPDVVILDLNLPRKDGKEVLREIRDNQLLKDLPVFIYTGSVRPEDRDICLRYGANGFLNKPNQLSDYPKLMERLTCEEFPKLWNQNKSPLGFAPKGAL